MRATICRNCGLCQVSVGELQDEVRCKPDEMSARLERPLLEAREDQLWRRPERPADAPDSGGKKGVLGRPALVVEATDRSVRPRERSDDEQGAY
jgi:hypothetical protein